jgi:hypothetical protein
VRLADDKLREAYTALRPAEKLAVTDLLRYVPGGGRAKLQASAMRRIKAMLKRKARAGKR